MSKIDLQHLFAFRKKNFSKLVSQMVGDIYTFAQQQINFCFMMHLNLVSPQSYF